MNQPLDVIDLAIKASRDLGEWMAEEFLKLAKGSSPEEIQNLRANFRDAIGRIVADLFTQTECHDANLARVYQEHAERCFDDLCFERTIGEPGGPLQ
jgi:hypothetical protein